MAVGTSGRCRPEAERHSAAAHREHSATGAVATGAAVIGAAIGGAIDFPITNPFLSVDLVFRSSTGIPITATIHPLITRTAMTPAIIPMGTTLRMVMDTIITASPLTDTATVIKGTAPVIKGTAPVIKGTAPVIKATAPAIDLRLRSCSADWLEQPTITAPP